MFILFADMESNDGEELDFEPSNVEAGGSGTGVPDNTADTAMQVPKPVPVRSHQLTLLYN
jgi:hypothetical protein